MLQKGTNVAGYRVDGILGQGGMGVVYEATQLSLDRVVALKVLAVHLSDDIAFQTRFKREGQIQAAIDHPHIVTVFDSGRTEHGFFIAMRLVRGPNLKDLIVARQLDAGRTLRILTPVAEALDTAHAAALIHRDIKPQNILVAGRDHSFLADFGLTKASGDASMTKTGQFVGTLDYISPEQIRGERAAVQSDIYALAGVMYECLTGVVPFPKESEAAVLYAHMADPPPRVTEQRPELPGQLDEVLARAMAKDPAERPASAGELMLDVNRAFSRRIRAAFTPPGPIEVPEETGIRPAEMDVGTRESQQPAPEEPRAPEPTRAAAPAPPPEVAPPAVAPGETVRGAAGQPAPAAPAGPPFSPTQAAQADARVGTPPSPAPPPGGAPLVPAEAPAPPVPRAPPRPRQGISPGLLATAAGLLLLVIVAGFLIGRSGSSEKNTNDSQRVAAGPLSVSAPSSWRPGGEAFAVPGLPLEGGTTLAPGGTTAEGALATGATNAVGPTLLPAAFVRRLRKAPAPDDPVRLGNLDAYRYTGLHPRGLDRPITVYVAPTTKGVATIVCAGPGTGAAAFLADCEGAATTLELETGKAYPLGGDPAYSAKLKSTVKQLNVAREKQTRALSKAATARGQAQAAQNLTSAYRRAARPLASADPSPEVALANARVIRALQNAAAAYQQLSKAARSLNRGGYRSASKRVAAAESDLQRALRSVGED